MVLKKPKARNYDRKMEEAARILGSNLDEYGILKYREILLEMHADSSIDSTHTALSKLGLSTEDKIHTIDVYNRKIAI